MSRYVDIDLAYEKCPYRIDNDGFSYVTWADLWDVQLADVRENTHGEWIKNEGGFDPRDNFYHCSECGRVINVICGDDLWNYPFCHCGANMRKGEEDE